MYKYNIIERISTHWYVQFRYTAFCYLSVSIIKILSEFHKYRESFKAKVFEYIVIENNIFVKI
jgi:hypothetical protein